MSDTSLATRPSNFGASCRSALADVFRPLLRWPRLLLHLLKAPLLLNGSCCAADELRLAKYQLELLSILGLELEVVGQPCEEVSLWACNHISWLDAVVMGSFPGNVSVAKAEVSQWPLIGPLVAKAGTLFIQRGANQANTVRDQMVERLEDGLNVVLYPEATTTAGDQISYVFPRLLSAATMAGVPIQPVSVSYSLASNGETVAPYIDDMRFLPHLKRLLRAGGLRCRIQFLSPLDSDQARDGMANQLRQSLASSLSLPATDKQKQEIDMPALLKFLKTRHGI